MTRYALVSLRLGEQAPGTYKIFSDRIPQPGDEFGIIRAGQERTCWQVVEGQYGVRLATGVEALLSAVPCAA